MDRKQRRAAANLPMGEWVDNGSFLDSQNTGWLGSQGLRSSHRPYIAHGSASVPDWESLEGSGTFGENEIRQPRALFIVFAGEAGS